MKPSNLTCRVCGAPLVYGGRGAPPESHTVCRTIAIDVARVERGLIAAWDTEGVSRQGLRRYLTGELWRVMNEHTGSAIQRAARASPAQRLRRLIEVLSRTRPGRAALEEAGLVADLGTKP